jgi:hypothetical protein
MGVFQDVSNWLSGSYKVRTTKLSDAAQLQHVRLDVGTGTAESPVDSANPLPVAIISGGGGGDASAANQVLEIAELTTLNATTATAANQALEITELQSLNANVATAANQETEIAEIQDLKTGIFGLLQRLIKAVLFPPWVTSAATGQGVRAFTDTNSTMGTVSVVSTVGTVSTVSAVTAVSSLNGINSLDSRHLVWNGWNADYRLGLRSKIT